MSESRLPEGGGILVIGPVLGLLMWAGILLAASMVSGCGVYVHRGDGAYSFVGPGSYRVAGRCSAYPQKGWTYDYSRAGGE